MSVHLFLVPTLLLSLLACTKEERLPLATVPTSFEYAGRLVTCEATTSASYYRSKQLHHS
jgi:hypothetical protein